MSCAESCSVCEWARPAVNTTVAPSRATRTIVITPAADLVSVLVIAFIVILPGRHTRRHFALLVCTAGLLTRGSQPAFRLPDRVAPPSGTWKAARRSQSRGRLGPWVPHWVHPSPFPFKPLMLCTFGAPYSDHLAQRPGIRQGAKASQSNTDRHSPDLAAVWSQKPAATLTPECAQWLSTADHPAGVRQQRCHRRTAGKARRT